MHRYFILGADVSPEAGGASGAGEARLADRRGGADHQAPRARERRPGLLSDNLPPSTLNPQPSTLNPQLLTVNPQPSTLNPQLSTLNSQLSNPTPHSATFQGYP